VAAGRDDARSPAGRGGLARAGRRAAGTGKSTLAGALADRLGFTVLSSDRVRKELAGVPAGQRCAAPWGTGIYAAAWTERVYAELLGRAGRLLALGEPVIADASFISPAQRAAAAAIAAARTPTWSSCGAPRRQR
jgi:predicted kinase